MTPSKPSACSSTKPATKSRNGNFERVDSANHFSPRARHLGATNPASFVTCRPSRSTTTSEDRDDLARTSSRRERQDRISSAAEGKAREW